MIPGTSRSYGNAADTPWPLYEFVDARGDYPYVEKQKAGRRFRPAFWAEVRFTALYCGVAAAAGAASSAAASLVVSVAVALRSSLPGLGSDRRFIYWVVPGTSWSKLAPAGTR